MKKYLTIAAVLGAIAFLSVSYLAKADTNAAPAAPTAAAPAPAVVPAAAPADAASLFAKDSDMCNVMATAPTTEGAAPSAEAKDAAYKKCMTGKGHTEEELKKAAEDKPAKDKEAAPAPAPAAK